MTFPAFSSPASSPTFLVALHSLNPSLVVEVARLFAFSDFVLSPDQRHPVPALHHFTRPFHRVLETHFLT